MHDFGRKGNLKKYNKCDPPKYNVSELMKIKIPLYFYIGD